jgi:tripartite-type tricarboxylate transporter receptor subunit TctC
MLTPPSNANSMRFRCSTVKNTMLRRFNLIASFVVSVCFTSFLSVASAQTWPSQPLKIIVPFAPGGSSDFIARLISKPLSDALGVSVLVENRAGNAGNLGAGLVAQATDGHTVLLSDVGSLAIGPLITKDLPFKLTDLKGVAMLGYSPHLLAIYPGLPANNLKELVAASKVKRVNVASAGSGSPKHVPYKGGAQAMTDTMGGTTEVVLNGMLATMPHIQSGKLKVIAVSKRTRVAALANTPTVAEQGVADFESGTYQGVTVSANMPAANVAKLNAALVKVMQTPEIRTRMQDAGAEVTTSTPEEITTFLGKEKNRWESVIKRAGADIEGTK